MNFDFIYNQFVEIASLYPERKALDEMGKTYNYAFLHEGANKIAALLQNLGVKNQEIIGVLIPPGERLIRSMLGIFSINAIYLPLDLAFSKKRISEIFSDNICNYLITDVEHFQHIDLLFSELNIMVEFVLVINDHNNVDILKNEGGKYVEREVSLQDKKCNELHPNDGNYIVYTSGTSGRGNAILGAHRSLAHFISWEIKEFGITKEDRISMLSQHTFDASFRDIFVPLCTGATLCIPNEDCKNNLMMLIEWLDEKGISLIHCVPSLFRALTRELETNTAQRNLLKSLKYVLMAGETLYAKDINRWQSIFGNRVEIVNLYGTSETTLAKTFHRISNVPDNPSQILHVGKPIDNTFVAILNGDRLCRIGEIGEIFISTSYMTKGYINNEELNKTAFVKNPLIKNKEVLMHRTGDQGRYLKDRSIEVLGRLDNQVKVNGIRIELEEVDRAVLSLQGIEAAITVVYQISENLNEMVCYYISSTLQPDQIPVLLGPLLNKNVTPGHFIKLDEFPLTLNGKVDKKGLPRPDQILPEMSYQPPSTATEIKLEQIWREVLGLEKIGINTSFFKIGGRSLKAMQMISRIYREMNVNVKISEVMVKPTISELAKEIDALQKSNADFIPLAPLQEHYALSSAQKSIWIMSNYNDQTNRSFNMIESLLLQGELELNLFENAFKTIINRHESLRTNFIAVDGQPRQKINASDEFDFRVEFIDLVDNKNSIERAKIIVYDEHQRTFNLELEPLIRIKLIKLKQRQFVLILSLHHIIADGWSMEILSNEFITIYESFLLGNENSLKPLRIQYKDFTCWQNAALEDEKVIKKLANYWKNQFMGDINPLNFGKDNDFGDDINEKGDRVSLILEPTLTSKLMLLAENENATLFMVLISFYYVLLYQYTGQSDIVIGCPATYRAHPDLENQIGLYLNTLPFRVVFQDNDSYLTLLDKVKSTTSSGFDYQLYPLYKLVEDLDNKSMNMTKPLFNVMFDMLEFDSNESGTSDFKRFEISQFNPIHSTNKSDLILYANSSNDIINLHLGYDTSCFSKSKVIRMLNRLVEIMKKVIEHPSTPLAVLASQQIELPPIQAFQDK